MKQIAKFFKNIDLLTALRVVIVALMFVSPLLTAHAQLSQTFQCDPSQGLNCDAGTSVNGLIRTVIDWMLGIAFGIAVLFLIIGGFRYITSQGNEESAEKGKSTVINALIGIIIIVLSYVIVNVVSNLVSNAGNGSNSGL